MFSSPVFWTLRAPLRWKRSSIASLIFFDVCVNVKNDAVNHFSDQFQPKSSQNHRFLDKGPRKWRGSGMRKILTEQILAIENCESQSRKTS
jgi:hypothetical protein